MKDSKDLAAATSKNILTVTPLKCSSSKKASKPKHGGCGSTC